MFYPSSNDTAMAMENQSYFFYSWIHRDGTNPRSINKLKAERLSIKSLGIINELFFGIPDNLRIKLNDGVIINAKDRLSFEVRWI